MVNKHLQCGEDTGVSKFLTNNGFELQQPQLPGGSRKLKTTGREPLF